MYDTNVTVVGNALTTPEWRRFERTNALVANFKIASTSRRFDKQNNRWIDGDNLRVRVNCWRRLAEGVVASVKVGDPLVVTGRLYTRDWTTEDGTRRSAYELEAVSVGHDLSRGIGVFRRGRINVNTTVVEDAETDKHVKGEPTEAAPEENARSEALGASLDEELRSGPVPGHDGPVNPERASAEDLNVSMTGEMNADLDRVIDLARKTFGTATLVDTVGRAPADSTGGGVGDGTGAASGGGSGGESDDSDEAASAAPDTPNPGRLRRSRSRVAANA